MLFILGAEGSRYGGLHPETGASAVKEDLHTADLQRPKPHPHVATRLSTFPLQIQLFIRTHKATTIVLSSIFPPLSFSMDD